MAGDELSGIDRSLPLPAYAQIADLLREEVRRLNPGESISSESQLIARFGVARMTVRQAIATLRAEGLLVPVHGKGVFVAPSASPLDGVTDEELLAEVRRRGLDLSSRGPTE